jgi:hypothetical protein
VQQPADLFQFHFVTTMDATTIAIQWARVAAVLTLALQAISLFMALEDNNGTKQQRTNVQQCMYWDAFVQNNKD